MVKMVNKIELKETSLVAFDFDGTLTTAKYRSSWQAVHEYFGTWASHGEPALQKFLRHDITYYEFCKLDAEAWINRTEIEYRRALDTIKLREGVNEFINFLRKNECILVIISMGLGDIVERFAYNFNIDYWIANNIIRRNNIITGEVEINIDLGEKGRILEDILEQFHIQPQNAIAIGDASADLEMFDVAGISIAIEPHSERVATAADFVSHTTNLKDLISFFEVENHKSFQP
ncbi:MAG: HAD family hydrolase [Candidatus Hodarchaeota archaeon]